MKKKFFAVVSILCVFSLLFSSFAFARPNPNYGVVTETTGNNAIISVYLDNCIGVASGKFYLDYPENAKYDGIKTQIYRKNYTKTDEIFSNPGSFTGMINENYGSSRDKTTMALSWFFLDELYSSATYRSQGSDINGEHYLIAEICFSCTDNSVKKLDFTLRDDNGFSKQLSFSFKSDCDHDFSKKIIDDNYFYEAATCNKASQYYYACSKCGVSSKGYTYEVFETGEPLTHKDADKDGYCDYCKTNFANITAKLDCKVYLQGNQMVAYIYLKDSVGCQDIGYELQYDNTVCSIAQSKTIDSEAYEIIHDKTGFKHTENNEYKANTIKSACYFASFDFDRLLSTQDYAKLGIEANGEYYLIHKYTFDIINSNAAKADFTITADNGFTQTVTCKIKEETQKTFVSGDMDEDGQITAADARLILRFTVSLEKFTDQQKKIGDMDSNGKIEAADARFALRTAVGLEKVKTITL